jgi:hypothetical protein
MHELFIPILRKIGMNSSCMVRVRSFLALKSGQTFFDSEASHSLLTHSFHLYRFVLYLSISCRFHFCMMSNDSKSRRFIVLWFFLLLTNGSDIFLIADIESLNGYGVQDIHHIVRSRPASNDTQKVALGDELPDEENYASSSGLHDDKDSDVYAKQWDDDKAPVIRHAPK